MASGLANKMTTYSFSIRSRKVRFSAIILGLLTLHLLPPLSSGIPATSQINLPQQLTADLSQETSPVLSPNGKWLVFVTNRSGNYDLWIRRTDGGLPVQLTTHPAADYNPAWAPSGEKLCFCSTREDPAGDLYILKFKSIGGVPQVTSLRRTLQAPGQQTSPSFSPDGKHIAFQDGEGSGGGVSVIRIGREQAVPLTSRGFVMPAFSPIDNRLLAIQLGDTIAEASLVIIDPGDLKIPQPIITIISTGSFPVASASWSTDAKSIVASLVAVDVDHDGLLTATDQTSLYRFDLVDSVSTYRQLTSGTAAELSPSWAHDGTIYYSAIHADQSDLWRVSEEGIIPFMGSADAAFVYATSLLDDIQQDQGEIRDTELSTVLMAFERVRYDFPDDRELGAKSLLYQSRLLRDAGQNRQAINTLRRIPVQYSDQSSILAQALFDYQILIHNAAYHADHSFTCENPSSLISNLTQFISIHIKTAQLCAEALLTIGSAYESVNDSKTALEVYQRIELEFAEIVSVTAQAGFRTARIYQTFASSEASDLAYVDVIANFPDQTEVVSSAVDAILEPIRSSFDRIGALQALIGRHSDLPSLRAAAQLEIAKYLEQAGDIDLAIAEYERLQVYMQGSSSDYIKSRHAIALINSAELLQSQLDYTRAGQNYDLVIVLYPLLFDGRYAREAKGKNLQSLVARGDYTASQKDWQSAISIYSRAAQLAPEKVEIHRKRIMAAWRQDELPAMIGNYKSLLTAHPEDPILKYALGFCYSYLGDDSIFDLLRSIDYLNQAIAAKPDLAYGYLTLANDYEMLESHKLRQYEEAQTTNVFSLLWKQFRTGFGLFRNTGDLSDIQGHEKAIEVLELGLAVNDADVNPELEGQLYLSLGNAYYQLGEFGYRRAFEAFRSVETLHVGYQNRLQKALVDEKVGHCASVIGLSDEAVSYYDFALTQYREAKQYQAQLRILLRLAEHHQVLEKPALSNSYYQSAMQLIHREGLTADQSKILENVAYNSLLLGDDSEALRVSEAAQKVLQGEPEGGRSTYYNPLIIEIGGLTIPLWDFGYLGVGSPMSALGFSTAEKRLLNEAQFQTVYERLGNLPAAFKAASHRLSKMIDREDNEGQAILWNEIGALHWQMGASELAGRCFLRSYSIARGNGYQLGELTALINLAALQLTVDSKSVFTQQIQRKELNWLRDYEIGVPADLWDIVADEVLKYPPDSPHGKMRRRINRRLFRDISTIDPLNQTLDLDKIYSLLLLYDQPLSNVNKLRITLGNRLESLAKEPESFAAERIQLYNLYGKLCYQSVSKMPSVTFEESLQRLKREAEVLWAFTSAQQLANDAGESALVLAAGINLSDFYLAIDDPEAAEEVLDALISRPELNSQTQLIWRACWRKARVIYRQNNSELREDAFVLIDRAIADWGQKPWDSSIKTSHQSKVSEPYLMLNSAIEWALGENNPERVLQYSQYLSCLRLKEITQAVDVKLKSQRRSLVWNGRGGLIPYYRRQMADLQKERSAVPDSSNRAAITEQLDVLTQDYDSLLQQTFAEDPEFSALFNLTAFSLQKLQRHIGASDLVLPCVLDGDEVTWLGLTRDTLFIAEEADDYQAVANEVILNCPLASHAYIIAPDDLAIKSLCDDFNSRGIQASRLPNLQSLVFLDDKIALGKGENLSFDSRLSSEMLHYRAFGDRDELIEAIENANIAVFNLKSTEAENPLDMVLVQEKQVRFTIEDLFGIEAGGELLVLSGSTHKQNILAQIGSFAGWGNILFIPEEIPSDLIVSFLNLVISAIVKDAPGDAIGEAKEQFSASEREYLSKIVYFGKGGLNQAERQHFAQKNFIETVRKGNYNLENGQPDWAVTYYNRAIKMAEELQDSVALINLNKLKIKAGQEIPDWKEVVKSQIALLQLSGRTDENRAGGLRNLSIYYYNEGNLAEAIQKRQHALDLAIASHDTHQAATDNFVLAHWFYEDQQAVSAEGVIDQAKQLFLRLDQPEQVIQCAVFKARLLITNEKQFQASRELQSAAGMVQQLQTDSIDLSDYYLVAGLAEEGLSNYRDALENSQKAIQISSSEGQNSNALAYLYSANAHWMLSDYQQALNSIREAKGALLRSTGRLPYLIENSEALIYFSSGMIDTALEKAKGALDGAISARDLKSQSNIEKNIGLIETANDEYDNALIRFARALSIDMQLGYKKGQGICHLDIGSALVKLSLSDSAGYHFQRALELSDEINDVRLSTRARLALGGYYLDKRDLVAAKNHLDQASSEAREYGFADLHWRIATELGHYYLLSSDRVTAINQLRNAISISESIRGQSSEEKLRINLLQNRMEPYELLVELYLESRNFADAIHVIERAKALTFRDIIAGKSDLIKAGAAGEEGAEIAEIEADLDRFEGIRNYLLSHSGKLTLKERDYLSILNDKIDASKSTFYALLDTLNLSHAGYSDLFTIDPKQIDLIQQNLSSEEAIIQYFITPGKLHTFVISHDLLSGETTNLNENILPEMISNIRLRLLKRLDVRAESAELYKLLIRPVEQIINDKQHLIIIPTAELYYLPFALLSMGEDRWLIDDYSISYASSANIFSTCRMHANEKVDNDNISVLALANPESDIPQEERFFNQKEIESIGFASPNMIALTGDDATETNLIEEASQADIIHLACKGLFDAENPLNSRLFLNPDSDNDGNLDLAETYWLELDSCQLIALTACETGSGVTMSGDDIAGVSRGFMVAGTPRLVSSLWEIDDLATAILVKHFYRNL
ncbi:MAG: CHAT domain-containing protein, partial [bacterium]